MTLADLLALHRRERGGSLAETAAGVRELSDMFNGVTPHRPGYLAAARLRRAYVQYYLPVNAEKVRRVLEELETYAPFESPPRVLDFGCGPGTAALAFLLRRPAQDLVLVDVVQEALDDAALLARALGARPRCLPVPPAGETFDLILAANVLAETAHPLEDLLSERGHLVVIEPALKSTTRKLMEWRDRLAARGFRIAAPCLGQAACPMLSRDDLWCHQDIPWPRPGPIAEVDRRIGLAKETLKFAYAVVTRSGPTLADRSAGPSWRLVSNLHKEKGKAWAWCCGREGPLCRVEVLTRHRSPATAPFFRASRGDVLNLRASGEFSRSEGPITKESPSPQRHRDTEREPDGDVERGR